MLLMAMWKSNLISTHCISRTILNAYDPCDINFTSFTEYTATRRHAKALKNAMADATDHRAEEAWTFHQVAEAERTQALYGMTLKLIFQHAAEVAKLCKTVLVTKYLIVCQAAKAARIRSAQTHFLKTLPLVPIPTRR